MDATTQGGARWDLSGFRDLMSVVKRGMRFVVEFARPAAKAASDRA
jgi:hypothetical protein